MAPTSARRRFPFDTGGPWGTGLLLLGVAVTVRGIAYVFTSPDNASDAIVWIDDVVSLRAWGLAWIVAGAYSIVQAFTPPQRHIDVAPGVGVITLWAALYLAHWLSDGLGRGYWDQDWLTSVILLAFAAVLISWSRCVNPPVGHPDEPDE